MERGLAPLPPPSARQMRMVEKEVISALERSLFNNVHLVQLVNQTIQTHVEVMKEELPRLSELSDDMELLEEWKSKVEEEHVVQV
jgi:hypothetical protein